MVIPVDQGAGAMVSPVATTIGRMLGGINSGYPHPTSALSYVSGAAHLCGAGQPDLQAQIDRLWLRASRCADPALAVQLWREHNDLVGRLAGSGARR